MNDCTEDIWKEYHDKLHSFILSRVNDKSVTDDILQEVFIKIHTRIDTLKDHTKLRSWMYQITRNTIIDHYRKHKDTFELPETLKELEDETQDDKVMDELASCVRPFIDSLPNTYREALRITEIEGMTQKEMGQRLGITLSGAKARVQRGRRMVKDMLMECCHFEFDRSGKVIDYTPRSAGCPGCGQDCK